MNKQLLFITECIWSIFAATMLIFTSVMFIVVCIHVFIKLIGGDA